MAEIPGTRSQNFTDFTEDNMSKTQLVWVSTGLTPYNAYYLK